MSKVASPPSTLSPEIDDERLPDNDETPPVSVLVQRTVVIVSSRMRELTVLGGGLLVMIVGTSITFATSLLASKSVSATCIAACTPDFAALAIVWMNFFALRSPSFARITT